jgi:tetratricopeptide (TPR) repeat protein
MPYGNDVVKTLLAASRFGALGKRQHILSMAAKSMRDPGNIPLQAEIVHQQSVLLRLKGDTCGSKRQIQEFLNRLSPEPDLRSHFILGLLHLSQATNLAYDFDFCQAHREAQKWEPPLNHMQRHMDVVWDQVYFAGRTLKGQGNFNEAKKYFECCLATDGLRESKRILVKSNLADLYGELDYLQRKGCNLNNSEQCVASEVSFLDNAEEMVKPEIECLKASGQHSKGFRRLLLALIEVEIRRCQFDNAAILITEILGIYSRLTEPDIIDRLGHVRALIARARISPLSEAEGRWSDALNWNRRYNPLEEEVFTCGLVYLFICSIRFQLRNWDGSRAAFIHATEVINSKMPQFLIPGVGTYLFDSVRLQIKSVAGWEL